MSLKVIRGYLGSRMNSDHLQGSRVRFRLARYRVSRIDFCQDSALLEVRMTFAFGNTWKKGHNVIIFKDRSKES